MVEFSVEVKKWNVNSRCCGWPEFSHIHDTDEQGPFMQNSCYKARLELKLDKQLPVVLSQALMHLDFPVFIDTAKLHFP